MKKYIIIGFSVFAALAVVFFAINSGEQTNPTQGDQNVAAPKPSSDSSGQNSEKRHPMNDTKYASIAPVSDSFEIPTDDLSGKTNFYTYSFSGKNTDFFVVKDKDGKIHIAGDACQVCWSQRKGYFFDGDVMQCRNCGNRFPLERIALEKNGCNPAPISADAKVVDGKIKIAKSAVEAVAEYF